MVFQDTLKTEEILSRGPGYIISLVPTKLMYEEFFIAGTASPEFLRGVGVDQNSKNGLCTDPHPGNPKPALKSGFILRPSACQRRNLQIQLRVAVAIMAHLGSELHVSAHVLNLVGEINYP